MNIDEVSEEIFEYRSKIKELVISIAESEQAIADYLCPFEVGDAIRYEGGPTVILDDIRYVRWPLIGFEISVVATGEYAMASHHHSVRGYEKVAK